MEFEEIENGFKATVPLITEAITQYIIKKQQEQIERLKRNSIPKKKIENKLEQLNSEIQYCARQNGKTIKLGKIVALQKLLEEDK